MCVLRLAAKRIAGLGCRAADRSAVLGEDGRAGDCVRGLHGVARRSAELAYDTQAVLPSPATHAILRLLKAGESVFQTLLLIKQCFMHIEGHNQCFLHFLASKHCLGTLLSPAFNETGLRD